MPNALSQEIAPHLPHLRRYARALTGLQQSGDAHVVACLDALVSDPSILSLEDGAKIGLYRLFHELWTGLRLDPVPGEDGISAAEQTTQERLAPMTPAARQVLLLTTLEGFSASDAGKITGHSEAEVGALLADADALWAIADRIGEFGFSPNRVAALGVNVILLVNLAWSAVLSIRFLRGRGPFATLERWQTNYLYVYAAWAAVVVVVFPPAFGFE